MIKIRELRESDLFDLAKLYEHYTKNTVFTYYTGDVNTDYMRFILYGLGHVCLVATEGSRAVGYVHLSPQGTVRRYYCELAVYLLPAYTGQGIGQQLVQAGERKAFQMGYKVMKAAVCTENEKSMAMFERLGYKKTTVQQNASRKFGRALHTQFFEKQLHKWMLVF